MGDTWRTTWSVIGLRVFYLVPRGVTDAVLPLTIIPTPSETVRVLVGRVELVEWHSDVSCARSVLKSSSSEPCSHL